MNTPQGYQDSGRIDARTGLWSQGQGKVINDAWLPKGNEKCY